MARKKAAKRKTKKRAVKKKTEQDPIANVNKLSEIDCLRFGKLDAEIRNRMQGMQLVDHNMEQAVREHNEKMEKLKLTKQAFQLQIQSMKPQYDALLKELSEKHGISDPRQMIIDPDSGTIRDARTDL